MSLQHTICAFYTFVLAAQQISWVHRERKSERKRERTYRINYLNSICSRTAHRQSECIIHVYTHARMCDGMLGPCTQTLADTYMRVCRCVLHNHNFMHSALGSHAYEYCVVYICLNIRRRQLDVLIDIRAARPGLSCVCVHASD